MAMSQGAWVCHFLAEIVELVAFIFSLPFRLLAEILSGGGGDDDLQDAHDYFVEEGRKHLAGARDADLPAALRDELALAAVGAADHAIAIGRSLLRLHPSPFAVKGLGRSTCWASAAATRRGGERRRDAPSALDAALSAGYGYHDLLPLEERADALVARAEIELARYLRCTLLNSGHRGQAIADLREAVRIYPDNGRANALLLKYN